MVGAAYEKLRKGEEEKAHPETDSECGTEILLPIATSPPGSLPLTC
ncbi:hypothetical protein ACP_1289 [Acidobacterium capsulatum ATCC 51196]|uniref:Uncharacterized protein n=1 Tax=Acidobacterium capsulatum (strain ATCC 51196 / DSM 11244 / BCRC 80197 / JCM 7670 / NBRC 15755 / NCIMB 13165 / 161) TaxID=240015 RepID=C1F5B7_ACIC5|nr:hypothetical protein ACP_1289 [Acidobacterium capsulatum ATCC 51196]